MALAKNFRTRLLRLLDEEELDLYVLGLHYQNDGDLNYFPAQDRHRIKAIFDILVKDTKRHADLLKQIVKHGEK